MKVEFFHDVLCAWAYTFSPRMRRLVKEYPEIEVIHRAFALAPEKNSISDMFGSKESGRREILTHWRAANENDDEHRIRADLMERREFDYPYSMPGLMACKSAEMIGGQNAHWDYFDRVQMAHLTEARNIADDDVLLDCAMDVDLDMARFRNDFKSDRAKNAVLSDMQRAYDLGVNASPTIVVDGKHRMSGAQKYGTLKAFIEEFFI